MTDTLASVDLLGAIGAEDDTSVGGGVVEGMAGVFALVTKPVDSLSLVVETVVAMVTKLISFWEVSRAEYAVTSTEEAASPGGGGATMSMVVIIVARGSGYPGIISVVWAADIATVGADASQLSRRNNVKTIEVDIVLASLRKVKILRVKSIVSHTKCLADGEF